MAGKKANAEDTNQAVAGETEQTAAQTAGDKTVDYMKEMTKVILFKDNDKYKDDVFVSVNGRSFQIKRGVAVDVPVAVKEVLDNSMESDSRAVEMLSQIEDRFEAVDKK